MFDLAHLAAIAGFSGVQWSYESEDLDGTSSLGGRTREFRSTLTKRWTCW
jgi:hypothetical protein